MIERLAKKMFEQRIFHHYSQDQMAHMIPMPQSSYSKIERAMQEPNLFQLKRIAEILEFSVDEVLDIEIKKNEVNQDLLDDVKLLLKTYRRKI